MMVSGGDPSVKIGEREEEYGLSQVFIAISLENFSVDNKKDWIDKIVEDLRSSTSLGDTIYYPGEQTVLRRKENMIKGVEIDGQIWDSILALT